MLFSDKFLTSLEDTNLFIDTNVLIGALYLQDFRNLIHDLKTEGCAIITVPSVAIEFLRGSKKLGDKVVVKDKSPQGFNDRTIFYQNIVDTTYPIERHLDNMEEFIIVVHNTSPQMDYADITLAACLYQFRTTSPYLMTTNTNHFPTSIFDRKFVLTTDDSEELMNYCVYRLSLDKFNKASENVLKMKQGESIQTKYDDIPF
jgi:hypothetical protein